jgi:hypothetical protein
VSGGKKMPSKMLSNAELLYILRQKIQNDKSFAAALAEFIETYQQGGSMALFAKYPAPVLAARGRPKDIPKKMEEAIQKNFSRVDRITKEIFKSPSVTQRERRIVQEFGPRAPAIYPKWNTGFSGKSAK